MFGADGALQRVSHPTRVRGLKLEGGPEPGPGGVVAPHAGAWIETLQIEMSAYHHQVAPHAGAWIET